MRMVCGELVVPTATSAKSSVSGESVKSGAAAGTVGEEVGAAVGEDVGSTVGVDVGVLAGVEVGVRVAVDVRVGVGATGVLVAVAVRVGVGAPGVGVFSTHTATSSGFSHVTTGALPALAAEATSSVSRAATVR